MASVTINADPVQGGLDIVDYGAYPNSSSSMRAESSDAICPNLQNDEYWSLYNSTQWTISRSKRALYVNVFEHSPLQIFLSQAKCRVSIIMVQCTTP